MEGKFSCKEKTKKKSEPSVREREDREEGVLS